jgi:3-isopropylmalate/(R)-2-methylmalate dehydratase small subunit
VIATLQDQMTATPAQEFTLDIGELTLSTADQTWPVQMEAGAQQSLCQGTWDACAQLLANREAILATAARLMQSMQS